MSWLEYDNTQQRPDDDAFARAWEALALTPRSEVPAAIADYQRELGKLCVNGSVRFAQFDVVSNRDFDWFATRRRWQETDFCKRFLLHPALRAALPDVTAGAAFKADTKFDWRSALTLDGELAEALVYGGAYLKFAGSAREAKTLGARCCDALFGDRFVEVEFFRPEASFTSGSYSVSNV